MAGSDDLLVASGVDAITGDFLLAPQSIRDVAAMGRITGARLNLHSYVVAPAVERMKEHT
jgi:hypothetical protein